MSFIEKIEYCKTPKSVLKFMLENKHGIKAISTEETGRKLGKTEAAYLKNAEMAIKYKPWHYDFAVNMIAATKIEDELEYNGTIQPGERTVSILNNDEKDMQYLLIVKTEAMRWYFGNDGRKWELFKEQLNGVNKEFAFNTPGTNLQAPKIIEYSGWKQTGKYEAEHHFRIAKAVFKPMLVDSWQSGYIKLPAMLYPALMSYEEALGKTVLNALFKTQLFGLKENRSGTKSVTVEKREFLTAVFPGIILPSGNLRSSHEEHLIRTLLKNQDRSSFLEIVAHTYKGNGYKHSLVNAVSLGEMEETEAVINFTDG